MRRFGMSPSELAVAAAAIFFIAGLSVDVLMAGPGLDRTRALKQRRATLQQELTDHRLAQSARDRLARFQSPADHGIASVIEASSDPVDFVGTRLTASGLRRIELGVVAGDDEADSAKERLFLRAEGGYAEVLGFVRDLERGRRLVCIESFSIQSRPESSRLELRMSLSVYPPEPGSV